MTRVINPKKKFNPTHRSAGLNKGVELENIHWHQEKPVDSGGQPIDLTQYEILDCTGKKALNVINGCLEKTQINWLPICVDNITQYTANIIIWNKISNIETYKTLFLIDGIVTDVQPTGNIVYRECNSFKREYIAHVSGCIETQLPIGCRSSVSIFNFSDTDMVGFTITANDGNGNFTIIQEQTNQTAHDRFLLMLNEVSQPDTRVEENIGNGLMYFYLHNGNVTNIISISPTEVQFDFHVEPGVTDIPSALPMPCVDVISNSEYQNTASQLKSLYESAPLNILQPNSGIPLTFTLTNYQLELESVFIPAKQILYNNEDGTLTEEYRALGDINTILPFNPLVDKFGTKCESESILPVPFQVFCLKKPSQTVSTPGSVTVDTQNSLSGLEQSNFANYPSAILPIPSQITVTTDLLNSVPQDAFGVNFSNSTLTANDLVYKVSFGIKIDQASGDTTDTVQDAIGGGVYDNAGNVLGGTFTVTPPNAVLQGNLGYISLGSGHSVGVTYDFTFELYTPQPGNDLRVFFGFDDIDVGSTQNGIYTIEQVNILYNTTTTIPGEEFQVAEIRYSDGTREFKKEIDNTTVIYDNTVDTLSFGKCENITLIFSEKETCGTIDGSTSIYDLIKVIGRDPSTGFIVTSHYEYLNGTIVTGIVNENCDCSCNTICEQPLNCNPITDFSITQTELDCLLSNGFTLENLCTMNSTNVYTELTNLGCKDCVACSVEGDGFGNYEIVNGILQRVDGSFSLGSLQLTGDQGSGPCPSIDKYEYFYQGVKVTGTNDYILIESGNDITNYPINPPTIHPVGTAPYYLNATQLDTANYTYSFIFTYKRFGCPPLVFELQIIPSDLNRRCDAYNQWINGATYLFGDKGGDINGYDALMNNLGLPALAGAPRKLRYLVESININGNLWSGQFVDILVPTANWQQVLANGINAIVGQNILSYNGVWQVSYNTAWSTFHIVLSEWADDHNNGFVRIGGGWAFRLNNGVMEDGIGTNQDASSGSFKELISCVDL